MQLRPSFSSPTFPCKPSQWALGKRISENVHREKWWLAEMAELTKIIVVAADRWLVFPNWTRSGGCVWWAVALSKCPPEEAVL